MFNFCDVLPCLPGLPSNSRPSVHQSVFKQRHFLKITYSLKYCHRNFCSSDNKWPFIGVEITGTIRFQKPSLTYDKLIWLCWRKWQRERDWVCVYSSCWPADKLKKDYWLHTALNQTRTNCPKNAVYKLSPTFLPTKWCHHDKTESNHVLCWIFIFVVDFIRARSLSHIWYRAD